MELLRTELVTDAPSLLRIKALHPILRQIAVDCFAAASLALSGKNSLRVTYSLRTMAQQAALYAKGRTAPGPIVTKAGPGQSYHNYGLALDFVLMHRDGKVSYSLKEDLDADGIADWHEVANAFKAAGWSWGGEWNFHDNPHVELIPRSVLVYAEARKMRPWQRLQELRNQGDVDAAGYVILPELVG